MSTYKASRVEFERLVHKALSNIPAEFQSYLDNVVITVDDEPPDDMGDILGIYEGIPLGDRTTDDILLPDSIVLYKGPIERVCTTSVDLEVEIRQTILHEIGHFFGLNEEQVDHL
tara:strand:- start:125 stop:469 length:345 start_codon:yes stop_codon:yes gene_type:complete